jgi:predicted nucleic acid-binding protein
VKVLFDINVVLDVLLERKQWVDDSARLLDAAERKEIAGHVAAHTITTAYYIVAKNKEARTARAAVADLLRIFDVVPLSSADFSHALVLGMADFEDAVQVAAAARVGADFIATRNDKDFKKSPVKARTPAELLAMLD